MSVRAGWSFFLTRPLQVTSEVLPLLPSVGDQKLDTTRNFRSAYSDAVRNLWGKFMRSKVVFCLILASATVVLAKEPKQYQRGKLLQMDSVACGTAEKDANSLSGEILGTDSGTRKTQEVLCQDYVLQADHVSYQIRPRDEKHPALLPVGEDVQFRIEKDKMLLRVENLDQKEREFIVVSMTPRSDASSADATPVRLNHLQ